MKTFHFGNYEEFACAVVDKLDEIIQEDKYNDISIVAKYEEARQIIKELVCIGADLKSLVINDIDFNGYNDEYIISVINIDDGCNYEIFCQPMRRESGYITDDSKVMYVFDNCSSKVIPYCEGETIYEVSVGEESECDDECCCDCCKSDEKTTCSVKSDDNEYTVSVKCNLDANEAEKIIKDMERRIEHMNDMFKEMDYFRRMFRW